MKVTNNFRNMTIVAFIFSAFTYIHRICTNKTQVLWISFDFQSLDESSFSFHWTVHNKRFECRHFGFPLSFSISLCPLVSLCLSVCAVCSIVSTCSLLYKFIYLLALANIGQFSKHSHSELRRRPYSNTENLMIMHYRFVN